MSDVSPGDTVGIMARYVSNLWPQHAPILAFTPSEEVYRQLALCWGTYPMELDFADDPNATIEAAEELLRKNKLAAYGDQLVIISDMRANNSPVDCVQLRTAKCSQEGTRRGRRKSASLQQKTRGYVHPRVFKWRYR